MAFSTVNAESAHEPVSGAFALPFAVVAFALERPLTVGRASATGALSAKPLEARPATETLQ